MTVDEARLMFAHRVRMASYSENFRGVTGPKLCPLCHTHLDNQKSAFTCPVLIPNLNKLGKYENIFRSNIQKETIENIKTITQKREEKTK